ncbi:MAG: PhzF family phenazine biosynthesis protein [Bacteroidota bacterium]|nr:PhzF family phenazine biosynthesis protein [Bacteroidota bacterium]
MKSILCKRVDAFTDVPHKGNPAGVVTRSEGLNETHMQLIARDMNYSETVFVLPATSRHADLRLRWFTPTNEVPLCGHATIAAFHALAEENLYGMKEDGTYSFRVETTSGILPVEVGKEAGKAGIKFGLPLPRFEVPPNNFAYKFDFFREIGIKFDEFGKGIPAAISGGNVFLPVRRLSTLYEMRPLFDKLGKTLKRRNLTGACVFSLETVEPRSSFHSRYFAPNDGINEDPVTGSTNGPLGVYMVQYGVVPAKEEETITMVGEQGDVIGKRGRVSVEVKMSNGYPSAVFISGRAVSFGEEYFEM